MDESRAVQQNPTAPLYSHHKTSMRSQPFLLTLSLLAGCQSIPTTELSGYTAAFDQVLEMSEEVLVDYSTALEQSKKRAAPAAAIAAAVPYAPYPPSLDPYSSPAVSSIDQDIAVRREALAVVRAYNALLTTLAEGRSIETVRGSAKTLVNSIGSLVATASGAAVPGLGAITSIAQTLAGELERARLRKEFRKALANGDAVVQRIFSVLIADSADHYALHVALANERRVLIVAEALKRFRTIQGLIQGHAAIASEEIDRWENDINKNLGVMGNETHLALPLRFDRTAGTSPVTQAMITLAESAAEETAALRSAYVELGKQVNAVGRTLRNYRTLLTEAQTRMAELARAASSKQSTFIEINRFIELGFEVRRDLQAFRRAMDPVAGEPIQ